MGKKGVPWTYQGQQRVLSARPRFSGGKFSYPYAKRSWTIQDAMTHQRNEFLASVSAEKETNQYLQKWKDDKAAKETEAQEREQKWENLLQTQDSWSDSEPVKEEVKWWEIGANNYGVRTFRKRRNTDDF